MKERTIRSTELFQDIAVELQINEQSNKVFDNGMVLFERPLTDAVLKAIDRYNSGIKLNILQVAQLYKKRRAEMMIFKNQGGRK